MILTWSDLNPACIVCTVCKQAHTYVTNTLPICSATSMGLTQAHLNKKNRFYLHFSMWFIVKELTSHIAPFYNTVFIKLTCLILFHIFSTHSPQDFLDHLSDGNKPQLFMAATYDPEWNPYWVSAVLPASAARHPISSDSYPRTYCSNGHAV